MTERIRSRRSCRTLLDALLCAVAAACGDGPAPGTTPDAPTESREPLPALILSNPAVPRPAAEGGARAALVDAVVYASLPPGSVPDGELVLFTNLMTGAGATSLVVDGGFDPTPIAASAGDSLRIRIQLGGDRGERLFYAKVPPRRPPVIVRTDPPPGRRDVPLNARVLVVFSEPLSATILSDTAIRLVRDGVVIPGTLSFDDAARVGVAYVPAAPLEAGKVYTLRVTRAVTDAGGESLDAAVTISFTTSDGPAMPADTAGATPPPPADTTGSVPPGSPSLPPGQGRLRVSIAVSGDDLPTQYYAHLTSGCDLWDCGFAETRSLAGTTADWPLMAGSYQVRLTELPFNCSSQGVGATVQAGEVTDVRLDVACSSVARINVRAVIAGDVPAGVLIARCGTPGCVAVAVTGDMPLTTIEGRQIVTLDVPANCQVTSPNPVAVTASRTATGSAQFDVNCQPAFDATLRVITRTSGVVPAEDFVVAFACWEDGPFDCLGFSMGPNASRTVSAPSGTWSVYLSTHLHVGGACVVTSANAAAVVLAGGGTREVVFDVTCQ